jgi:hypothetical protein
MIDRLRLLSLLNVVTCDCSACQWRVIDDIADGLESDDPYVTSERRHGDRPIREPTRIALLKTVLPSAEA